MVRGTFANPRLQNRLANGREGGFTRHQSSGEIGTIFDAAERYRAEGVPLVVIAGADYGTGSSRHRAAKGTTLLGVRAVIAESFERIHRSNLIGMGVVPLQLTDSRATDFSGAESIDVIGPDVGTDDPNAFTVWADGVPHPARRRIDTRAEETYLEHGGILPFIAPQPPSSRTDVTS
jgi:aconitate hydratase